MESSWMSVAITLCAFNVRHAILCYVLGGRTTLKADIMLFQDLLPIFQRHLSETPTLLQRMGFVMYWALSVWVIAIVGRRAGRRGGLCFKNRDWSVALNPVFPKWG